MHVILWEQACEKGWETAKYTSLSLERGYNYKNKSKN